MRTLMTLVGRKKLAEARLGMKPLSPIKGIAIGDGSNDAGGNVIELEETDTNLKHELLRKDYEKAEKLTETSVRYRCTLGLEELSGKVISEIGLFDEEGDMVAMRVFKGKPKDGDMEMSFEIDDIF